MFDPQSVKAFHFHPYRFDVETGVVVFRYSFDDAVHFEEVFEFPVPQGGIPEENLPAIRRALTFLALATGVSYYKAAIPEVAVVDLGELTEAELDYFKQLYADGLGEFAYVNKLHVRDRPEFRVEISETREVENASLADRALVAVGGGKDSCVSGEAVRSLGKDQLLVSVNKAKPILDVIEASELPSVHVGRSLSTELFRLNKEGAYNGHIPVTAIVSLALVVTALIERCDAVVMSNERSASVGNVQWDGVMVNHQFSKSLEAERRLADLVSNSIAPNLRYFSLLRPLSELDITRRFSELTRYHDAFTSCNRAYRIDESRRSDKWCGDCPKCRFVFLALAPFVERERLVGIFGVDMLEDESQTAGFDELIGWNAHKPFECVGEVEESLAALLLLDESSEWRDAKIVRRFTDEILPLLHLPSDLRERFFVPSAEHHVPADFSGLDFVK